MSDKPDISIAVEGLVKHYGDVEALRGIDFRVRPGEVVGFLGPNGAGKTTAMRILTSSLAMDTGRVEVAGFDVVDESMEVRRRIGYLPENVPLYTDMLTRDYLVHIARLREVPEEKLDDRLRDAAEQTGLMSMMSRTVRELSKGYRQRLGLAQAIIHRPEVLILDEPTTGLDPNQIVEIRDVITSIGAEKTVMLSTHILQEVNAVCDRIIILCDGEIACDDSLEALCEEVGDQLGEEVGLEAVFRWFTDSSEDAQITTVSSQC